MSELTPLNPRKFGVHVRCTVCGHRKQPVGRSASPAVTYCNEDCPGYEQEPRVGSLWPNESEADFGWPVSDTGTEIRRSLKTAEIDRDRAIQLLRMAMKWGLNGAPCYDADLATNTGHEIRAFLTANPSPEVAEDGK
jgi:hypothetical protein